MTALFERTISPTWDYQDTTSPTYFTVVPSAESDQYVADYLSAAVGTAAPTQWIGPNTVALALGYLRPFRPDPFFFDPDLFVVTEDDGRWVVQVNVRVRSDHPVIATAVDSAFQPYNFYGILTADEPETAVPFVTHGWTSPAVAVPEVVEDDTSPPSGSFAEMAMQVKERAGLSDEQLGRIFPVTREQFQRWRTGRAERPSPAHIRRMASLRDMIADAETRVDSVRDWLLIPSDEVSPYDLLCQARFEEAWNRLARRPSVLKPEVRLSEDGAWEQVPRVAVRSSMDPDNSPPILVSDDDDE